LYERKLNDKVNEFEKRIGQAIANNAKERHEIQEYRCQIMKIKQEVAALDQVELDLNIKSTKH
jgi:hypothetical protein